MKRRNLFLAVFAAAAVLAGSAGNAWAYFTTYVEAQGTQTIALGDETTIEEPTVANWVKHVVITSDADSEPVYVRAKAFTGSKYPLVFSDANGKWTPGEGEYYYYSDILNAGEKTEELLIKISDVPDTVKDPMELNVAVIYETTPVLYDEDGNPYADWNGKLDVTVEKGGSN